MKALMDRITQVQQRTQRINYNQILSSRAQGIRGIRVQISVKKEGRICKTVQY